MATYSNPPVLSVTMVTVAQSQTATALSTVQGTYLDRLLIQPAAVGAGTVILYEGSGTGSTVRYTYTSGTLVDLKPFEVHIKNTCGAGATPGWYLTTGANVTVTAFVQQG